MKKGQKGPDGKHMEHHMRSDGYASGHKNMAYAGVEQGDMSPHVKDYEAPMGDFSQSGFSKTLQYIERQDHHRKMAADKIEKHGYMGRYS